jgi:hypothetical protein
LEPSRHLTTTSVEGGEQDVETRQRSSLGLGWIGRMSGDMRFAVTGEATYLRAQNTGLSSDERIYSSKQISTRFALTLATGFSLGLMLQVTHFDVPKLRFRDDVVSDTRGYVAGGGAGLLWGDRPEKSIGVYYIPMQHGSAAAEGESRVLARPSIAGLELALPWSEQTTMGLTLRVFKYDDGADANPGLIEDGGAQKAAEAVAGLRSKFGGTSFYRLAVGREIYAEDSLALAATRVKLAFGFTRDSTEAWMGMAARWGFGTEESQGQQVDAAVPLSYFNYMGCLEFKM